METRWHGEEVAAERAQTIPHSHVVDKNQRGALPGMAQWIECQPANQRVASLILSLGYMPGLQARSPGGSARDATIH